MITGVVCICSRGLIHSRTMESVERNLREARAAGLCWEVEFTHDKPIPHAQNDIVRRALERRPALMWFVEEDNVVPDGQLMEMLGQFTLGVYRDASNPPVIVADYPLVRGLRAIYKSHNGRVIFSGMGCLLVPATVFAKIAEPWFEVHEHYWNEATGEFERRPGQNSYGGQDVDFFYKLFRADIPVIEAPRPIRHLRLKNDIIQRTNNGCFEVIDL